jgi:NADP-reducing hydrogenase subunit HndB
LLGLNLPLDLAVGLWYNPNISFDCVEVEELTSAKHALGQIRARAAETEGDRLSRIKTRIIVGTATCGVSAGAKAVVEALEKEITDRNLHGAAVTETGCSGRCDLEPLVQVQKEGEAPVLYFHVNPEKARRIIQQHVQMGEVIQDWVLT